MDDYLYHATHLGKAESIAVQGLQPSRGSQFGGGYAAHSRGRVFLTDFDGLGYWLEKMENIAEVNSDFCEEDDVADWMPVALRISTNPDVDYFEDKPGNRDNKLGRAYYVEGGIPADTIEIWDGSDWVLLEDADLDQMRQTAIDSAEYERDDSPDEDAEDDEESEPEEAEGYYLPDFGLFLPPEA